MDATSLPRRAADAVGESAAAERIANAQRRLYAPIFGPAQRSVLHTKALGHSVHPVLTDLTLGCWTSTTLLDLLGGAQSRRGATLLAGAGVLAAIPTAVAGAADWVELSGAERRVGAVHAVGADLALVLFMGSFAARLRGRHRAAARLAVGANLVMVGAGFLGGHLALNRGTARR